MRRFLSVCLLGSALMLPVAMRADDDDHQGNRDSVRSQRYWDKDAREWHTWNDHERDAYRRYTEGQHRERREWEKANKKEQRNYWRWRHSHPDVDDRR